MQPEDTDQPGAADADGTSSRANPDGVATGTTPSGWVFDDTAKPLAEDFNDFFMLKKLDGAETKGEIDRLVASINRTMDGLNQKVPSKSPEMQKRLSDIRDRLARTLRNIAENIVSGLTVEEIPNQHERIGHARGIYFGQQELIANEKLIVDMDPPIDPKAIVYRLLPVEMNPSQEMHLIEVLRTCTIVSIVLDRGRSASEIKTRRQVYLTDLRDIAREGISNTVYAQKRLEAFKDAFVAREADSVKNQYVNSLGLRAIIIVLALLGCIGLFWFRPDLLPSGINFDLLLNFLILAIGACVGTWLSFSLRRVNLSFADLALLEEDRLAPLTRLVFVLLLTVTFGLILESDLVGLVVGDDRITISGKSAVYLLALGVVCGIAERSLSSVISQRADAFFSKPSTTSTPGASQ